MTDLSESAKSRDEEYVRLVAMTKGVGDLQNMCTEDIISYAARVSSPKNQENLKTAPRLLRYCIKEGHWSVLETCSATFEIHTSLAIATQILRHRSFTFQQHSGRYAMMEEQIRYPARRQDDKNRQNSIDDMTKEDKDWFETAQRQVWDTAKSLYDQAIDKGIAKEQARMLLPMNTKTRLYMTGNLRNWIHYIQLRESNGTQKEHAKIAKMIKKQFMQHFPIISEALQWT